MRLVARQHPEDVYVFTDVVEAEGVQTTFLDMTDIQAVNELVDAKNIHSIVNCAAYTNVDKAETDQALCRRLNADAPRILAEAMKRVGGLLIHISTDYVFGGAPCNTPCREDQKGTPTGVYGQTKLEGEQTIQQTGCQYVILRTAWLYSEYGKNFVKTMLNLTATKPALKVVFDQVGTPTYALDLAEAIARILEDYSSSLPHFLTSSLPHSYPKSGIYHYSNEGVTSWYDFTKQIAEYSGHVNCDIQPCHSDEYPSPVVRPPYSVLDKSLVKKTFGVEVPYWRDSLAECISRIK